ncbi:MAG: hypothetical protein LBQ03_03310 [Puniceicoccales bacterium]|jgi:hypothetical protein|nr:hypothetical protein [Puniceicoccales bacterium]
MEGIEFLSGFNNKERLGLVINFIVLFLVWVISSCLCNGSQKWGRWGKSTSADVQDLVCELPLIARGMIWNCPRPLIDRGEGLTKGKTIKEIREMLNQWPENVCRRSLVAYINRQYCLEKIEILSQKTVGKVFADKHKYDVKDCDLNCQKFFISRIAFRLCPSLDNELVDCIPLSILADVVNISGDMENRIQCVEVRRRRCPCQGAAAEAEQEREFRIEIFKSGIGTLAFEDIKNIAPDMPALCLQHNNLAPRYLYIRMVNREFPIDKTTATTLIKTLYLHD